MPQVIKTNIYSLNTQRQLDRSQSALSTSLQRLSSGLRINSAKDDAAGLAISERMSAQISGLNVARRNANDGISLSQTAESAISTIGEMLRRMRDLAVQAANATNSDSDRVALNEEVTQLKLELQRIGDDTNYNGRKLLDGSFTNQYFQIGANAGQTTIVNLTDSRPSAIGAQFSSETKDFAFANTAQLKTGNEYSFDINGIRITVKQTAADGDYSDIRNSINRVLAQTNVQAEYKVPGDPTSGLTLRGPSFDLGNFISKDSAGVIYSGSADYPEVTPQLKGTDPLPPMDNINVSKNGMAQQTLSIYGSAGTEHIKIPAGATAKEVADIVNSVAPNTGVEASGRTIAYMEQLAADGIVGFKLYGSNTTGIEISAEVKADDLTNLAKAINDQADRTGITAELSVDKKSIKLINEDGYDICIEDFNSSAKGSVDSTGAAATGAAATHVVDPITGQAIPAQSMVIKGPTAIGTTPYDGTDGDPAIIRLGAGTDTLAADPDADSTRIGGRVSFNSEHSFRLETNEAIDNTDPAKTGTLLQENKVYPSMIAIEDVDISTREGAEKCIISVDAALTAVNSNRAKLGAVQSRFDNAINNLQAVSENLSAARSRIRDADYASETSSMASAQIIQQAGISMLTQANSLPQNVMALLQGM